MALIVFQMEGPWLVFKAQQLAIRHEIKQQIKAGVPKEDRVTVAIPKMWEEQDNERFQRIHAGEFRLDGQMYDNLSVIDKGDTLYYECIHDVKESGLFAKLDALTASKQERDPAKRRVRDRLNSLLSPRFICQDTAIAFFQRPVDILFCPYLGKLTYSSKKPESPPPESA